MKVEKGMKRIVLIAMLVFVHFQSLLQPVYADMEWTVRKELAVESAPRDVALSLDGQLMFVLVSGEVLIYSTKDDKVIKRIPVEASVDKLFYSPADNNLLLASRSGKTVTLISLDKVYAFDVAGVPLKGPADARVTLAVFSDYQ